MRLLKVTEEYRAESEQEVKEMNEQFKNEAKKNGYLLNAFSYTKKEKKAKGEIVDEVFRGSEEFNNEAIGARMMLGAGGAK